MRKELILDRHLGFVLRFKTVVQDVNGSGLNAHFKLPTSKELIQIVEMQGILTYFLFLALITFV